MSEFEFTDRYETLGIPHPDTETMCEGQCEGIGVFPVREDDDDGMFKGLWQEAHGKAGEHECDGYHFVKCPDCSGTGKCG